MHVFPARHKPGRNSPPRWARPGEDMTVKVIEINGDRIRASRKAVLLEEQGHPWSSGRHGKTVAPAASAAQGWR